MIKLHKNKCSEEAFEKRYPQISFLLRIHPKTFDEGICSKNFKEELSEKKPELILLTSLKMLEEVELLFSYLKKCSKAKVIIFEKHLGAFSVFLDKPYATSVIDHPQIELRYILEDAKLENALREAVFEYPTDRVALFSEQEGLLQKVLREATLSSSIYREDLYYHFLFRNLLKNFQRLHKSFDASKLRGKFKGIPAIVCGAGPSLSKCIQKLKTLQNHALIFAGGSTLTALSKEGVEPHFGFAVDPNPEEYERLHSAVCFETPILYASRLQPETFSLLNGKPGYMRTSSGGASEKQLEKILNQADVPLSEGLSEDALSVTTMAISSAKHFGCSPIILIGIDLAFTDKKCYAEGVVEDASVNMEEINKDPRAAERLFEHKTSEGNVVFTSTKWLMESRAISRFAKLDQNVEFIDCVEGGLGFDGIKKMSFEEALRNHLNESYDLKALTFVEIENAPNFSSKKNEIHQFLINLKKSLIKVEELVQKILSLQKQDTKKSSAEILLYEMDLEEELAYECFFKSLFQGIEKKYEEIDKFLQEYKRLFSLYLPN